MRAVRHRARAARARVSRVRRARSRGEAEAARGERRRARELRATSRRRATAGRARSAICCLSSRSSTSAIRTAVTDLTQRIEARRRPACEARRYRDGRGGAAAARRSSASRVLLIGKLKFLLLGPHEGEHVHLDVRLLRRVLVGVRLAVGARTRGVDLHPRDGPRGDAAPARDRGRRAALHSRASARW